MAEPAPHPSWLMLMWLPSEHWSFSHDLSVEVSSKVISGEKPRLDFNFVQKYRLKWARKDAMCFVLLLCTKHIVSPPIKFFYLRLRCQFISGAAELPQWGPGVMWSSKHYNWITWIMATFVCRQLSLIKFSQSGLNCALWLQNNACEHIYQNVFFRYLT